MKLRNIRRRMSQFMPKEKPIEKSKVNWGDIAAYAFTIVLLTLISIGLYYTFKSINLLANNNRLVKGVILNRQPAPKNNTDIKCLFVVDAKEYIALRNINYFETENNMYIEPGDSVYIRYYPPDPTNNEIDLENSFYIWIMKYR